MHFSAESPIGCASNPDAPDTNTTTRGGFKYKAEDFETDFFSTKLAISVQLLKKKETNDTSMCSSRYHAGSKTWLDSFFLGKRPLRGGKLGTNVAKFEENSLLHT